MAKTNHRYFTYILANGKRTLYTGVTSDLERRVWQHKQGIDSRFVRRHQTRKLVWFEETDQVQVAIEREKQLKRWHRQWKIDLINSTNPNWYDLASEWFGGVRDTESSSA